MRLTEADCLEYRQNGFLFMKAERKTGPKEKVSIFYGHSNF